MSIEEKTPHPETTQKIEMTTDNAIRIIQQYFEETTGGADERLVIRNMNQEEVDAAKQILTSPDNVDPNLLESVKQSLSLQESQQAASEENLQSLEALVLQVTAGNIEDVDSKDIAHIIREKALLENSEMQLNIGEIVNRLQQELKRRKAKKAQEQRDKDAAEADKVREHIEQQQNAGVHKALPPEQDIPTRVTHKKRTGFWSRLLGRNNK